MIDRQAGTAPARPTSVCVEYEGRHRGVPLVVFSFVVDAQEWTCGSCGRDFAMYFSTPARETVSTCAAGMRRFIDEMIDRRANAKD